MSARDRELAVLYWQLQKKVHTDPKIRTYLTQVTKMLQKRRVRPTALNDVGLQMTYQKQA